MASALEVFRKDLLLALVCVLVAIVTRWVLPVKLKIQLLFLLIQLTTTSPNGLLLCNRNSL